MQYLLTMLLDVFISSVLIDRITRAALPSSATRDAYVGRLERARLLPTSLKRVAQCDNEDIVPVLATFLVSSVTFFAYTNNTRFLFAIRDDNFPRTTEEYARRLVHTQAYETTPYRASDVEGLLEMARLGLDWEDVFGGRSRGEVRAATTEAAWASPPASASADPTSPPPVQPSGTRRRSACWRRRRARWRARPACSSTRRSSSSPRRSRRWGTW